MNNWKKFYNSKVKEFEDREVEVYDIGGGNSDYFRSRFKKYVSVDADPDCKPDIVANIHNLPFKDNTIECILCFSVLEHIQDPFKAVSELYRVMRPGSKALLSVPFIWPYHSGSYKDYWRFSDDGIKVLFKNFSYVEIVKMGGYFSALANFISSYTKIDRFFRPIAAIIDNHIKIRSTTPGYIIYAIK